MATSCLKKEATHIETPYRYPIQSTIIENTIIESNIKSKKQYLKVRFDKFAILNDDNKKKFLSRERERSSSSSSKENSPRNSGFPKIKLLPTTSNKPVLTNNERAAEKRLKMYHSEKHKIERDGTKVHIITLKTESHSYKMYSNNKRVYEKMELSSAESNTDDYEEFITLKDLKPNTQLGKNRNNNSKNNRNPSNLPSISNEKSSTSKTLSLYHLSNSNATKNFKKKLNTLLSSHKVPADSNELKTFIKINSSLNDQSSDKLYSLDFDDKTTSITAPMPSLINLTITHDNSKKPKHQSKLTQHPLKQFNSNRNAFMSLPVKVINID